MDEERTVGTEPAVDPAVALVRDLARRAYPDAVPELIDGATPEDVAASIEGARAAFARMKERIAAERPATSAPAAPAVPAGGFAGAVDPERLPAAEKIRRGLAARGA